MCYFFNLGWSPCKFVNTAEEMVSPNQMLPFSCQFFVTSKVASIRTRPQKNCHGRLYCTFASIIFDHSDHFFFLFSRVHATLQPALSVRPSVGLSVTLLLFFLLILFLQVVLSHLRVY